jgi:hypothetical protein
MRCLRSCVGWVIVVSVLAGWVRADEKVVEPFNGKSLEGWKLKGNNEQRSHWTVGEASLSPDNPRELKVGEAKGKGALVNAKGAGVDLFTEQEFGDCVVSLEVMVPKGSNSGIYVHGNYEVQILDSYGKEKVGPGDIGGIYGAAAPRVNAAKAPGEWQTFEIDFQAPRFKDGKKVANAKFLKVTLNGKVIHENVEVSGPTPSNLGGGEAARGPLMFQGDHGPVAYRNIKIHVK